MIECNTAVKNKESSVPSNAKAVGPAKYVYIIGGLLFLGLGAAGTVLPFVPTTPFVLLAAICFGRSSNRLYKWFISTRLYRNNLEGFVKRRALSVRAKLTLLATITVFMGFSFFVMRAMSAPLVSQAILAIIWALHVLYFGFKVKTMRK
ncbi:MAG: YbaN family protein [Oscillospiraceae bacterium]|nr:YbaN family protein [Oscillospiraceae bacterium]